MNLVVVNSYATYEEYDPIILFSEFFVSNLGWIMIFVIE